ncbi:hypothetical protein TNIN_78351, partial [Trichonephila inaurata madagascariensis]
AAEEVGEMISRKCISLYI